MRSRGGGLGVRLVIAIGIAAFSACTYFTNRQVNPVTGEKQSVALTPQQETAMGLQALGEMEQQFGGEDRSARDQDRVEQIGQKVVANSDARKADYKYDFHLLADNKTVNAFALPGGQIFITRALYDQLGSEAMLAGVLGHEVGHVVARHTAEQMAKQGLIQGLAGAATVATSDDQGHSSAAVAQTVANLVSLKFSRGDELEADALGVRFMAQSGYDPNALIRVMDVLEKVSGGSNQPEFAQTHPNPGNRREKIKAEIAKLGQK